MYNKTESEIEELEACAYNNAIVNRNGILYYSKAHICFIDDGHPIIIIFRKLADKPKFRPKNYIEWKITNRRFVSARSLSEFVIVATNVKLKWDAPTC